MNPEQESKLFQWTGRVEGTLQSIEKFMGESKSKDDTQDSRLGKLENKVYFIWFLGPVFLAAVGFLDQIKTLLGGK